MRRKEKVEERDGKGKMPRYNTSYCQSNQYIRYLNMALKNICSEGYSHFFPSPFGIVDVCLSMERGKPCPGKGLLGLGAICSRHTCTDNITSDLLIW